MTTCRLPEMLKSSVTIRCHSHHQQWIILYGISCAVISMILFLYGFFPLKTPDSNTASWEDVPVSVGNESVDVSELYKPLVSKLAFVIIDALRWDFVGGPAGHINMPYIGQLIQNSEACLLTGKAHSPTVTMPRIKALTTGTVPNFIDVVFNLGSKNIHDDNILKQAEERGLRSVFYGDDTWLKLFPNSFIRSDGVTSFYVPDFTEVDYNVTRHLDSELSSFDWHIMVLHYLGLDHIGHLEGPNSKYIRPKLQEMDNIVKKIHQEFKKLDHNGTVPLIIVTGDHGMKDEGSHGGASFPEITVPIIFIGLDCDCKTVSKLKREEELIVSQIDLVPTLSVLLGLPIPSGNLGKVILPIIRSFPPAKQLFSLHYNVKQIHRLYEQTTISTIDEYYTTYQDAVKLHEQWLRNRHKTEMFEEIIDMYSISVRGMSAALIDSVIKFDVPVLTVASILMCQVLFMMLLHGFLENPGNGWTWKIALFYILTVFLNFIYCTCSNCSSLLCQTSPLHAVLVNALMTGIMSVNSVYIVTSMLCCIKLTKVHPFWSVESFLIVGTVLHAMSFASSSFIEEEHQLWYFFWVTFGTLTALNLYMCKQYYKMISWVCILILHRIFRDLNHTGDKWASVPDIGDWLVLEENRPYLTAVFALGLFGVCLSCCYIKYSKSDVVLYILASVCIYYAALQNVITPVDSPQSRSVIVIDVFWTILVVLLVKSIWEGLSSRDSRLLNAMTACWLLCSALLHRPHNVILVVFQVYCSKQICEVYKRELYNVIAHTWLGMVFYFYQGNSNSLASIDLTAGYVGLSEYSVGRVGLQLFINTYSAPVLSYLLVLHGNQEYVLGRTVNRTVICMRVLPCALYVILMLVQRHHLFVWTVFSPKLLYEAVHLLAVWLLVFSSEAVLYINYLLNENKISTVTQLFTAISIK